MAPAISVVRSTITGNFAFCAGEFACGETKVGPETMCMHFLVAKSSRVCAIMVRELCPPRVWEQVKDECKQSQVEYLIVILKERPIGWSLENNYNYIIKIILYYI